MERCGCDSIGRLSGLLGKFAVRSWLGCCRGSWVGHRTVQCRIGTWRSLGRPCAPNCWP